MTNNDDTHDSIATPHGPMRYAEDGDGAPLLFVHGSPGGCDQGQLMGAFLVARGFRDQSFATRLPRHADE
jgi:pimeloyl-ACP methyl ester carboxylesterase